MSYSLEYIEWFDHSSHEDSGWRHIGDAKELRPILVKSLGHVVHEDEEVVVLAQNIHTHEEFEDRYAGDICILKLLINKRKVIKI